MVWKNHLVAIFAPTSENKGKWGTGIPVANDCVLTARHVLFGDEAIDDHIKLCWWGSAARNEVEGEQVRVFESVSRENILWSDVDLDAALIKCKPPEDILGYVDLDYRKPHSSIRWESEGFARVAKISKQRPAVSFAGDLHSAPDAQDHIDLPVDNPLEEEELWGGSSGMPIVSQDRSQIIAVCRSVPYGFNAGRLRATPTWKLWENERFRALIESDAAIQERKRQLLQSIIDALADNPAWLSDLAALMGAAAQNALQGGHVQFAQHLLTSDVPADEVLSKLHELHTRSNIDKNSVRKLATALAPAIVGYFRCTASRPLGSVYDGSVGLGTMAELVAAALDGRVADFRPRRGEFEYAKGRRSLPLFPEAGAGADAQLCIAKWVLEDLEERLVGSTWQDALTAFFRKENVHEYRAGTAQQDVRTELQDIARRLKRIFSARKFRFYLAIPTQGMDLPQLEQLNGAIEEIRSVLPDLLVFEIEASLRGADEDALGDFPFMLPMQGEEN